VESDAVSVEKTLSRIADTLASVWAASGDKSEPDGSDKVCIDGRGR
jgi:hypothetical protein